MKIPCLLLSLCILICGCSASISSPTYYYQFEQPIKIASRNASSSQATLKIQSVMLFGALNNRGIAIKTDRNQIHNANYHLWAESPTTMLSASAQQTLFHAMPNWMVIKGLPIITHPDQQEFYEIEYELHHFNGDMQGNANISGLWRVYFTHPQSGRQLISLNNFSVSEKINTDGYAALITQLEAMWVEINQNIAQDLQLLNPQD